MSRLDPRQGLMPSVLDRLIDADADGTAWRHGYGIEQMIAAVHRDLEELLNTRQTSAGLPADCAEVGTSIVAYGMPDLTAVESISPSQRAAIGRILEAIIQRYEPRLRDVRATLIDPDQAVRRTVKFRVEARLRVEPAPEVAFDTVLELSTGHSSITHADS